MKYKLNKKEINVKLKLVLAIALISIIAISLITLAVALTDEDRASLQSELDNLSSQLSDSGYSWLTDYSINYPSVEVYREGGNESIANFESISNEGWYKIYLTNLSENETQDVFDLKSGKYEKISYEIIQKKIRIDEIRKILNEVLKNG
ncbi:MAG: hypothetical protein AABW67_04920 [Nanoarchaeota archaeon]